jgi:DNA-binding NtrC family response regulator
MSANVLLISNDPSFIFMMTTIIDHLELPLQSSDSAEAIWNQIRDKNPRILIWDFEGSQGIEQIEDKFRNELPESCHLFVFSNALSGLSHLRNGRLHLFEKPFSPSEISGLVKSIAL